MSWAAKRRFIILLIVGAVVVVFLTIVSVAIFYKTPTCTDGAINQGETGVDCGGPCSYLCAAQEQPPTVLFTKAIQNGAGRVNVVAEVENKNADAAAKNVRYRITLYGNGQSLIQELTGTLDLPPGTRVLVLVPNVPSGKQTIVNAFLDIDPSSPHWFVMTTDPRIIPTVPNTIQSGSADTPRIEAVLANGSALPLMNVRAIVFVRDAYKNVIAASETILPLIPAQGNATATFTWNSAFSSVPASIEVMPIIPLP